MVWDERSESRNPVPEQLIIIKGHVKCVAIFLASKLQAKRKVRLASCLAAM